MSRNIEIKARISDIDFCTEKARYLSGAEPVIIKQEDTFFNCQNGRLKLRIFSEDHGELIFYTRPNVAGPKMSEYYISSTDEPYRLLDVLKKSYGIHGEVKKTRKLYIIGRTRVHIDQIERLGNFLEFEVVLNENEDIQRGESEATELMDTFNISHSDLISGAYVDILKNGLL